MTDQAYLVAADKRLQTLLATIAQWTARSDANNDARIRTISVVMRALAAFAEPQTAFFINGFDKTTQAQPDEWQRGFLDCAAGCAGEYVMGTMIEQIAADLGVYTQAISQRTAATAVAGYTETLSRADRLAALALKAALPLQRNDVSGLGLAATPITYFQKSPQVRIIPYAPAALIGIPFTAINHTPDLLGIGHEVGHYIFNQCTMPEVTAIDQTVLPHWASDWADGMQWLENWLEEIFADAYGFLLAGPAAGVTLQERLLLQPKEKFTEDDGVYPVSAVRGYIASDCLLIIAQKLPTDLRAPICAAAGFLENRWKSRLTTLGIGTEFTPWGETATPLTLQCARDKIKAALTKIYDYLAPLFGTQAATGNPMWSTGLADPAQADGEATLLTQFHEFIAQSEALTMPVPELQLNDDAKHFQLNGGAQPSATFELGKTKLPFDEIRDSALATGKLDARVVEPDWCSFTFGWGVKGRGPGHTHIIIKSKVST